MEEGSKLRAVLKNITCILVCGLFFIWGTQAEKPNVERRCFSFTWLGPSFNNQSIFMNATCQDATRLSAGVPCVQPLVVSDDGTWPDVNQLWDFYRQEASCVLNENDVCAQFTYYFNGFPENSTYMCTRAVNTMGEAITSGCYQENNGSASTRVCFCRSIAGGRPCNSASLRVPILQLGSLLSIVIFILLLTDYIINT